MRVCFLTTSYPRFPGDQRGIFIYKLVNALKKRVMIKLITVNGYKPLLSGAGIFPNLKVSWGARFLFSFYWVHFYLKFLFKVWNCDIIHANWAPTSFIPILTKPLHRKKIILTERWPLLVSTDSKFWKLFCNFIFSRVDLLVAISEQSKSILVKKYKIKNIQVIPNGVDEIKKFKNRDNLRKQLGLPLGKRIFLFVGRITSVKGIDYLLSAFRKLKDENSILVIVGGGENLENLKKSSDSKVIFTGFKQHDIVMNYMQASDVFVMPSLDETGGNVLLEARAVGLPIISTRVGWAESIIKDNVNGYFIQKRDPNDIYDKLNLLIKNFNLLCKNSKKSNLISWDDCAEFYEKEYNKLIYSY